jgi:hypothetical protein
VAEIGGKSYCGKEAPKPPADFGEPCSAPLQSAADCSELDLYCAELWRACEALECVRDPVAESGYCSMPCHPDKVACPAGYSCLANPSFRVDPQYVCFADRTPEERLGAACQIGVLSCEWGTTCPSYDAVGACGDGAICLRDYEAEQARDYCSRSCAEQPCPDGFDCVELAAPECVDRPDCDRWPLPGAYCVKAP